MAEIVGKLIDTADILIGWTRTGMEEYDDGYEAGIDLVLETIDHIPAVETKPKWISVKDRLPEERRYVLVWKADTEAFAFSMYYAEIGVWVSPGEDVISVSHWMPLPSPPNTEE